MSSPAAVITRGRQDAHPDSEMQNSMCQSNLRNTYTYWQVEKRRQQQQQSAASFDSGSLEGSSEFPSEAAFCSPTSMLPETILMSAHLGENQYAGALPNISWAPSVAGHAYLGGMLRLAVEYCPPLKPCDLIVSAS